MISVTIFILFFVQTAICSDIHYEESARHGGTGGVEYKIVCPHGGAITGLNFRAAGRVDQIAFVCTSSMGTTTIGPFGGKGGEYITLRCTKGEYVSSFFGRSAETLHRLGIRCRSENDMNSVGKVGFDVGGDGGTPFDDLALSMGARPVSITVRAQGEVDAIQVTYGSINITGKLCPDCTQYQEEWAPMHGGNGGLEYSFVCPAEGVITGIKYRSAVILNSIEFICTSSMGETSVGPFGGSGGTAGIEKCPVGSYIGSIHGRSAGLVDKLGIRCVKYGQVGGSPKRDGHGGEGAQPFDDEKFTTNGRRPVEIRVRAAGEVNAIQIKYGNMPVTLNCKVTKVVATGSPIEAQPDGIEVIGVTSGFSCAPIQQQLTLQTTSSVTESTGIDITDGGDFNWSTELSLTFTTGVNIGVKSEVSVGVSQGLGGSKSWSRTESKSTGIGSEHSQGTTVNYEGPGACIVIGFVDRYKIEQDNVPVLYHFQCEAGTISPQPGKMKLSRKSFNGAHFEDYQAIFSSVEKCTSEARICVANIKANKIISDPNMLETEIKKCVN